MSDDRLMRIEEKLDKMSEAIISLARMEERMVTLFKRMDNYDQQQDAIGNRLSKVEIEMANSDGSNKWIDRVIVAIITGAITLAFFAGK